jgi:hypothetical protein
VHRHKRCMHISCVKAARKPLDAKNLYLNRDIGSCKGQTKYIKPLGHNHTVIFRSCAVTA